MAKSFKVKKPPRRGGYPSSFSFLFGRKEKRKEAKRKEKPKEKNKNTFTQLPPERFRRELILSSDFNRRRRIPAIRIL